MAASTTSSESQTRLEDVLAYLPIANTSGYEKGELIYGLNHLSRSIYLVVTGKVEISQIAEDGSEVLLEVVRPDEVFGESAFLDASRRSEQARAIEKATLMTWAVSDIQDLVMKRPPLAVALLQVLALRNADFARRIESLSIENVEQRLARALLRFSERLGVLEDGGAIRMMPFTHETLARYVGTTREIVTHYMIRFRSRGYVDYSRRGILLYRESLETVLDKKAGPAVEQDRYRSYAFGTKVPAVSADLREQNQVNS